MAFILGLGRKTARQPHGRFDVNFGIFILGFLSFWILNLEASEMIDNNFGNVSVSGKTEISEKYFIRLL